MKTFILFSLLLSLNIKAQENTPEDLSRFLHKYDLSSKGNDDCAESMSIISTTFFFSPVLVITHSYNNSMVQSIFSETGFSAAGKKFQYSVQGDTMTAEELKKSLVLKKWKAERKHVFKLANSQLTYSVWQKNDLIKRCQYTISAL